MSSIQIKQSEFETKPKDIKIVIVGDGNTALLLFSESLLDAEIYTYDGVIYS